MLKFLLILLIIFIVAIIILGSIFKKFLSLFGVGNKERFNQNNHTESRKKNDGDVIYNKDDIVVMKGEAKDKKQKDDK